MRRLRENVKFREIKREIRIVGVDDCPFVPRSLGRVDVIGIVLRGGCCVDGAMRTSVAIDGFDATEKIAEMISSSPHYKQLRIIMLDGVTFAGFNIVDVRKLFGLTGLPVLALTRKKANMDNIKRALMRLERWEERLKRIQSAGEMFNIDVRKTELHMHVAGISREDAEKIVRVSCTQGNIPEPLRVAHIIASALTVCTNQ